MVGGEGLYDSGEDGGSGNAMLPSRPITVPMVRDVWLNLFWGGERWRRFGVCWMQNPKSALTRNQQRRQEVML